MSKPTFIPLQSGPNTFGDLSPKVVSRKTPKKINTVTGIHAETTTQSILPKNKYAELELVCDIQKMDCISYLKSLPKGSIDLVITDPAYSGMNNYLKLGNGRIVGNYSSPENEDWFEEFKDTKENYLAFLNAAYDAMKEDSHIYIMFDTFSLLTLAPLVRDVFQVKNLIVWNKVNMGLGHYFRRQHETILFATKGKKKLLTKSVSDVWEAKRKTPQYPTQKPVEIFEKMITASVRGKANVCDPFVGSGSSAIATLKHDCNFYGCDISLRAVTLTKKRVEAFKRTGIDILEINGKH